jgi:hypothetical protein
MVFSAGKIALMGVLIALAIALKLPILSIPNVELLTFVIFASGFLLGAIEGALVGVIAMSIYTTLISPYGIPPLPIAIAQIVSMGLIGLAGGLASMMVRVAAWRRTLSNHLPFAIAMGICGAALTIVYDLLTNLAVAFVMGQWMPVLLAAVPFALLHILSNLAIFLILSPLLLRLSKTRISGVPT